MKRLVVVAIVIVALSGCSSFKEGYDAGSGKTQGDKETRFQNAARAKDTSGALDSSSKKQLIDLGNGVCLRLSTPKPGTSSDETIDQVKADPPGDYKDKATGWNAIVDAAVQELCSNDRTG